jgi:hypothetical protein
VGTQKTAKKLKQQVLNPAVKQLNEKSDLFCIVADIKESRTITGFQFTFRTQEQNSYSNQGVERMKKLLITLMLISPFSFADWDDVYYCQMTTFSETTLEGKRTNYTLQKFTFKLDKTKNAMVFGKDGYLNSDMELREGATFPSIEYWYAEGLYSRASFDKGKILYARVGDEEVTTITADCDKF